MAGISKLDRVGPGDHVCWAFDHDGQQLPALARHIRHGLARREKVTYYTASRPVAELTTELDRHGVPVATAIATGQLQISTVADSYLSGGAFDGDVMTAAWAADVTAARAAGWAGLRAIGDMAWAARLVPGSDSLARYEATVNTVFSAGWASAVCLYDRRVFATTDLHRIYAAHPATVQDDSPEDWQPLLRIRQTTDPVGLRLSGEADASNRHALAEALLSLREQLEMKGQHGILDLTDLRFADVTAGRLLADCVNSPPGRIRLVGCSQPVARLLDAAAGLPRREVTPEGRR